MKLYTAATKCSLLGATSTSNKDITSFVTFKVKDAEGNDAAGFVVNNGNELNVAAADAGTYTRHC